MLKQRVITALILLAVLLPTLFHARLEPFAGLMLLTMVAAIWEWARLNGQARRASMAWALATALVLLTLGWIGHERITGSSLFWAVLSGAWVGLGLWMLRRGVAAWGCWPQAARLVVGACLITGAGLAMVAARTLGLNFLLSVLATVWISDIAAYFGGRRFGRRKLAPTVSPGKSWEGVFSGMAAVMLLALGWIWLDQQGGMDSLSLFSRLWALGEWLALPLLAAFVGMGVIGDLLESLVKRSAGVKDSSRLLPGHGGVLDRVDALLPVLPMAMLVAHF